MKLLQWVAGKEFVNKIPYVRGATLINPTSRPRCDELVANCLFRPQGHVAFRDEGVHCQGQSLWLRFFSNRRILRRAYPIIFPDPFGGRGVGGSTLESLPVFSIDSGDRLPSPQPSPRGRGGFLG